MCGNACSRPCPSQRYAFVDPPHNVSADVEKEQEDKRRDDGVGQHPEYDRQGRQIRRQRHVDGLPEGEAFPRGRVSRPRDDAECTQLLPCRADERGWRRACWSGREEQVEHAAGLAVTAVDVVCVRLADASLLEACTLVVELGTS
jgi:hypothetical protein